MIYKLNEQNGTHEYLGDKYLLSISGGKDSTAMILYMKEIAARNVDYVFMDTGWEDTKTYQYLDYLEKQLGITINRIRANIIIKDEYKDIYNECLQIMGRQYSDFVAAILNKGMFPSGFFKWCTIHLKIEPFQQFIDDLDYEPVSCVGIRRAESIKRSKFTEYEFNEGFKCWVWRPIIDWTEQNVIDIHKRHNIRPNPLYLSGSNRVGCYPCIYSIKKEIAKFDTDHQHIKVIRLLEEHLSNRREKDVRFFRGTPIDEILEWSKTSRGGKQLQLFTDEQIEPSCIKWGMCGI